jgi:hypothetical protein
MAQITYPTKNTGDQFTAGEANEIKTVVNTNDTKYASRAPSASPALTGTPTAPTAAPGTNTTQIATTAFVQEAVTDSELSVQDGDYVDIVVTSLGSIWSIKAGAVGTTEIASSVALVTPNLGTPSAVVLTNGTGLPLTTGVTGTLPIANGGTGTTNGISSAAQTALDLKANLASPAFTGTVSGITKSMVGLGSVDNTADTAKPVSTAQQTAIDAKVANNLTASTTVAPSKTAVNNALALKADVGSSGTATNIGATAAGDGVTDDRAAIQDAYDTAYAAGSRIFYLPAGTYLMSLSTGVGIYACLFLKPDTTLFGDGDDTVIKRDSGDLLGVTITYDKTSHNAASLANRNYHLSKFRILGTTGRGYESPIGSSETEAGIFLATAANRSNKVVIEHVRCEDLNKESIAVWDAVECTIRWNRVYNCNFDAYNPQLCDSLILTGNYAYGCNIGCEYEGKRTGGIPTHALISNNEFVNIYEYGIGVEAGDNVKITGNLLVGQTGSTTETFQAIGVYILPNQGNIDTLEISGNQIINFIQAGVSNSVPNTSDYVLSNLIIKGNTFAKNGENCIRLKAYSNAKILHTDISGNTFRDWNRIDNGTSVQWSAIHIEEMDDVSIHGNNSRNIVNGKRNDPLFLKNTTNVRFFNNDVTGPPSEFNSTLDVKQQGTNTSLTIFDNPGLLTVDTRKVWGETPSGTVDGVNDDFTAANTPKSGTLRVILNGSRMKITEDYTESGAVVTFVTPPEVDSNILFDYEK